MYTLGENKIEVNHNFKYSGPNYSSYLQEASMETSISLNATLLVSIKFKQNSNMRMFNFTNSKETFLPFLYFHSGVIDIFFNWSLHFSESDSLWSPVVDGTHSQYWIALNSVRKLECQGDRAYICPNELENFLFYTMHAKFHPEEQFLIKNSRVINCLEMWFIMEVPTDC